jgi:hypothetical protein
LGSRDCPEGGCHIRSQRLKSQSESDVKWPIECHLSLSRLFFFSDCDREWVLVSLPISI